MVEIHFPGWLLQSRRVKAEPKQLVEKNSEKKNPKKNSAMNELRL